MLVERETDLLTVADAARLLKVSTVTIKRWLKQGRPRAYRVGPRAVRIRRADLASMLIPATGREENTIAGALCVRTTLPVPPLTPEQVARRKAAIEAATQLRQAMLARRGGIPLTPSWLLIRRARVQRAERL
jgi:excisionase family DNA binding protein